MNPSAVATEAAEAAGSGGHIDKGTGHRFIDFYGYADCVELATPKARAVLARPPPIHTPQTFSSPHAVLRCLSHAFCWATGNHRRRTAGAGSCCSPSRTARTASTSTMRPTVATSLSSRI